VVLASPSKSTPRYGAAADCARRLQLVECNCRSQHVVRVRLPLEVKRDMRREIAAHRPAPAPSVVINIEEADFLEKQVLRRPSTNARRPLLLLFAADHPAQAVPRPRCAASGVGTEFLPATSSLVVWICNSLKADRDAVEFVRSLYRERRLMPTTSPAASAPSMNWPPGSSFPPLPGQGQGSLARGSPRPTRRPD